MKKVLLMTLVSLTFSAQANLVCNVAEKGIELASNAIITTLKCENEAAVLEDLQLITKIEQRCSSQEAIFTTSLTCKLLSNNAAAVLADKIPVDWKCDSEHSEELISDLIYKACKAVTGGNK